MTLKTAGDGETSPSIATNSSGRSTASCWRRTARRATATMSECVEWGVGSRGAFLAEIHSDHVFAVAEDRV